MSSGDRRSHVQWRLSALHSLNVPNSTAEEGETTSYLRHFCAGAGSSPKGSKQTSMGAEFLSRVYYIDATLHSQYLSNMVAYTNFIMTIPVDMPLKKDISVGSIPR